MANRLNILDRAIQYIAPAWAAERAYARQVLEISQSYRGGMPTNVSTPWGRSQSAIGGMSGDRVLVGNMRDRGRRAYKNNYLARAIVDTEADYVIGDGFTLQAKTDSDDFNREASYEFAEWLDSADIRGMRDGCALQRALYIDSRVDGDVGTVLVDRGGAARLQIIPSDLIDSPYSANESIVSGIEVNDVGRPVAFHVYPANTRGVKTKATRITADNFKYLAWLDESMGVRGVTCFAQVFTLLDQVDGYIDAVVIAARMAAIFGLIFKEKTGAKQVSHLPPLAPKASGEQRRAITFDKNGNAKFIGADDDIVQVDAKQPMSQTPDFVRAMLRLIGLPFQMPLELIAKDVSQSNLSALRGVRRDYMRACKPRQHQFVWAKLAPIYRWWVSRRVKTGEFVSAVPVKYWPHEFIAAKNDMTLEEVQAALLERDMGLTSTPRLCGELGRDPEAIAAENEATVKDDARRGLETAHSNLTRTPAPAPLTGGGAILNSTV